jgi:hypothetical protein
MRLIQENVIMRDDCHARMIQIQPGGNLPVSNDEDFANLIGEHKYCQTKRAAKVDTQCDDSKYNKNTDRLKANFPVLCKLTQGAFFSIERNEYWSSELS